MKILLFLTKILSAPFYLIAWFLYSLSFAVNWIGDFIHDQTEYKIWLISHKKEVYEKYENAR